MKYTKGPWAVSEETGLKISTHEGIFLGLFTSKNLEPGEGRKNALLASASPEMYEALTAAISCLTNTPKSDNVRHMIIDAINKAEGR